MLRLSNLFGEGCVLQRGRQVKIWGAAAPDAEVAVSIRKMGKDCADSRADTKWQIRQNCRADAAGDWEVLLEELPAGGPYCLEAESTEGERVVRNEVYVGEVWLCAGQSNMELPMERVKDRFPEEMNRPDNPYIRHFKVEERYVFDREQEDVPEGQWKGYSADVIREFSAAAYFFGLRLYEHFHVPVGLINVSKGGSRIEAWMSEEALYDREDLLSVIDAEGLREKGAPERFTLREEETAARWHQELRRLEEKPPENTAAPEDGWKPLQVPCFLSEAGLAGFSGSLLLRKRFELTEDMAAQDAELRLGTMVDSDITYMNGEEVGETGYQYPPRKYKIKKELLHAGENEVTVHLTVSGGNGRLTPGKNDCLAAADGTQLSLEGRWDYRILARCEKAPEMDFLCRKATGIFKGMLSPCIGYTVRGVLWYQGESNDFRPSDYAQLLQRMILSWRSLWRDELPFVIVQLPNFAIDLDEENSGWPEIREAQKQAEQLSRVAVTVNLGLGEDNDLHPLNKKGIADRAFVAARGMVYGEDICFRGPEPSAVRRDGAAVIVSFDTGDGGELLSENGAAPEEFELAGTDRKWYPADCVLSKNEAILTGSGTENPVYLRYAWSNAPGKGLLQNGAGILASPFRVNIDDAEIAFGQKSKTGHNVQ